MLEGLSLDIRTAVQVALAITILVTVLCLWYGIRAIRKARGLPFFRLRREQMMRGWRMLFWAGFLGLLALFLALRAEPTIYTFFPPTATPTLTPTITQTPTITLTPTISLTPTITQTPSVTDTPTITPTPSMPLAIKSQFVSTITPNPNSIFSPLTFTNGLDEEYRPLNPGEIFQNPVGHMYALFSYDQMQVGSQWSALWYFGDEIVYFESKPWDGGSGGLGYTDWNPSPDQWRVGEYEVQIFDGTQFKISGRFAVEGEPPTAEPTDTPTPSLTPTRTPVPTRTPWPTNSPVPSRTPRPTQTITLTPSITPTRTPYRPPTLTPTRTRWPTPTRTLTPTPTATRTPFKVTYPHGYPHTLSHARATHPHTQAHRLANSHQDAGDPDDHILADANAVEY